MTNPATDTAVKTVVPPRPMGVVEIVRMLLPYLWPRGAAGMRTRVVVSLLLLAAGKIANVYVPFFYRAAVNALGHAGSAPPVIALPVAAILAYGAARVSAMAFGELCDAVFAKVAQRAMRAVALTVFRHLHALSLRFHLERQTGGLSRNIERGTRAIQTLLQFLVFDVLPTLFEIVVVCAILWHLFSFWFALATFVTVAGYMAFTLAITEWRTHFRRRMNEMDGRASARAVDSFLNYETVKYFANEEHEARRYDAALAEYESAAVRSQTSLSILNIGQSAIIATGVTLVMYMAGRGIVGHQMTIGDFVMVNTYLLQLYQPLNFFGFIYREIKQGLIDMEAMFALLRVDRDVADRPGAKPLKLDRGVVEFQEVSFGYDPRRPILDRLSFIVPAGGTVAFVGASGAGKSTLGRLLFRFYDIAGGRILIDGQDIRDVTQGSLRASIGIVPQDTVLFNDTIYYNIAYGRPGATAAEVEHAARLAQIHDFVAGLPDGYETVVGERGLKLSGGEKQRVAIARTILKDPAILVFDEATSALDTHTEREIQASLDAVSQGRTTLVIAHRLSTVIDADEIIVMAKGRIIERGRHGALLARDGAYAAMWRSQQEAAQPDDPPAMPATAAADA